MPIPDKKNYNVKIHRVHPHELRPNAATTVASHANILPTAVDLRPKMPPVYDQGQLGSCTANALCAAFQYDGGHPLADQGSRLFVYFNERKLENSIPDDAGAFLSDGVKCLEKYGVCLESEWPYDISKFAVKPSAKCYKDALKHRALVAHNVMPDLSSMKTCLASGYPFVVAITIHSAFESDTVAVNGLVPMPIAGDQVLGGHAVLCVGYDDIHQCWIMRNSWGADWGVKGYFFLPYLYLLDSNLASDMWTITKVLA
jgi:C1A family cysteine protease